MSQAIIESDAKNLVESLLKVMAEGVLNIDWEHRAIMEDIGINCGSALQNLQTVIVHIRREANRAAH